MALDARPSAILQSDCDMSAPEEHFLWGLVQIPMGNEMMPIQPGTAQTISKHLHELGFRHHPKLQTKKRQMPVRGQQSDLNALSRWVPMDTDEPEALVLPDVKAMTSEEREWVTNELKEVGHITESPKDIGPVAEVSALGDVLAVRVKRATSL